MHIHILKFTQNGVTMTTGSCVSVPMEERERERERKRRLLQCDGRQRGLDCIMAVPRRDFIKAIQSWVFGLCGIFWPSQGAEGRAI